MSKSLFEELQRAEEFKKDWEQTKVIEQMKEVTDELITLQYEKNVMAEAETEAEVEAPREIQSEIQINTTLQTPKNKKVLHTISYSFKNKKHSMMFVK